MEQVPFQKNHHHNIILIFFFCLLFSVLQAQEQEISLESDKGLIATGQPVTFTCVVRTAASQAVWKFGKPTKFFLDTFQHSGSINVFENSTVYVNGYTNKEGHYVSKLTFPPSVVLALNNSNVSCEAKPGEFRKPYGEQFLKIEVYGAPDPPGSVRVVSERDLEITMAWDAGFIPFNITPQYKVYVDGELEATVDQRVFTLSRTEPGCQPHRIVVVAFNKAGSSSSTQPVNDTLPSAPEVNASVSCKFTRHSGQLVLTIFFEQARTCEMYPVSSYSVIFVSDGSSSITRMVEAPPTLGEVVSVTVEGLAEDTLYTYQITAHNTIGSTTTEPTPLYTIDVVSVIAKEMEKGALFLSCEFVEGTNVLGCQIILETMNNQTENLTHILYRSPDDTTVNETIVISTNLSCYHQVLVFDIESDNTTSALGRPGSIEANQSRPCTAAIKDPTLPLSVIIGISVPVLVILVIVVCCLVIMGLCKLRINN